MHTHTHTCAYTSIYYFYPYVRALVCAREFVCARYVYLVTISVYAFVRFLPHVRKSSAMICGHTIGLDRNLGDRCADAFSRLHRVCLRLCLPVTFPFIFRIFSMPQQPMMSPQTRCGILRGGTLGTAQRQPR